MINVQVKNTDQTRVKDKSLRSVGLFSFWGTDPKSGKKVYYTGKDKGGKPIEVFKIEDFMEFDPENKIDAHNIGFIKSFIKFWDQDLDFARMIEIKDPNDAINKALLKSQRIHEVNSYLQANREDDVALRNLFRRIVGGTTGRDNNSIFASLVTKATDNPDLFYIDGKLVVEHEVYQLQVMVDMLLEKGFFKQDGVGNIYRMSIKIASGVNDAVIKMQSDDKLMKEAKDFLNNPQAILPSPEVGEVDDFYKDILEEFDGSLDASQIPVDDLEFNTVTGEQDRDALYEFAKSNFELLRENGFILKDGAGAGTKYFIYDNVEFKRNKEGLINYLADNEGVVKKLVSLLKKEE